MKKYHLQFRVKLKHIWKSQCERVIVSSDFLQRDFTASEPNKNWVTDITYIQYGSTTKYLSTIMDLYNNEIVAYKLYEHQQTPLVMDTLKMALENRDHPEVLIIHSGKEVSIRPMPSKSSWRGIIWLAACPEEATVGTMRWLNRSIRIWSLQHVKFNPLGEHEVYERVTYYLNYYNQERIQEKLGYLTSSKYGVQAA